MKSNKPSNHSQKTKFLLAIIAVLSLAAIVTAGIVIKIGRVSNEVSVEQSSSRRFAGRGGNSSSVIPTTRVSKNSVFLSQSVPNQDGTITGATIITDVGIQRTVRSIMIDQSNQPGTKPPRVMPEHEIERDNKADSPNAPQVSQWPPAAPGQNQSSAINAPQTTALSFDGATLTDTQAFPPDSMGAVGPTQFVTFVNGRLRTFTKNGVADGVLNADPDVFFSSVKTPVAGAVVLDFTSDPNVRYDRFTGRWFLTIIDVPCTNATCTTTAANRLLIAVSDAASNGTISAGTVWTFFQFQADPGTNFLDYPSLGVDVNALYVGGNMFSSAGSFVGTNGYVIRKSTILGAGPVTVTMFANLATSAGAGPFSPRGVDNFDSSATEGYFVGVDTLTFSTLMFRRVSNPGSATPTISANISVTVPTTTLSGTATIRLVQHAGNTGGNNGLLDTLDDRLYAAMIRNGRLWTAHNFTVSSTGVASTAAAARNAARWYEFQNLTTTPTLVQSGTVFDNAATRAAALQYWIPSVLVNGQGHAVLGFTMAGTPSGATPAYVGRLAGDTLGTMTGPPTVAAATFGTTTANYNPAADPGGAAGRRWGDYSYTSLDPLDDMTIWTIQEYNQASNSYAVRVGKLLAPPPASPTTASPSSANTGQASVNVTITGTSSSGSGFYDPGANLTAPALPFTHISASVTGGVTVNSVMYTDPTHITLNISTVGASAGAQNITITNPDGQTATGVGILTLNTAGTAPTFTTCPTNQTVSADIGACSATVAFAPVASGSPSPTITCKIGATTITSPFNFPVGTSNVVCTATNGVAPDATCSFSVTVNDTQLPTVTCPANISTSAATNQCSAVVTYTTPMASDNCSGATVTCLPASGSSFNVGTTTVTCTPKDAANNTGTACTFTVTVNDTQLPTVTCPANISTPAATNQCSAVVTYTTPTASDNCAGATVTCSPASGSTFNVGTTTVTCTPKDAANNTGTACTFTVTVNDTQLPTVTCPANISTSAATNQCSAVVNYTTPTASDNCAGATVTCSPVSGSTFNVGTTTVTCTPKDAANNTGTACTFTVTVNDTQLPTVTCPANISTPAATNQCSAVVNYTTPTASDNCAGATVTCSPASGSTFNVGTTTVTCTPKDASNNTGTACTFTLTVNDTQLPTVTCPANISTPAATNQCSAVVTYTTPTASDNCAGATVTCSPASGSTFNVGTTTVTCTPKDAANNTGTACTFTVTVNDTQPPTIGACPANIMLNGSSPAVVNYTVPTASDNCSGATVTCVPASGSTFNVGTTTVTCTSKDAANNTGATCSFTVTITPCTITCPANQVAWTAGTSAAVTYPAPTTSGSCGTTTCTPASGSAFNVGTTTVTCNTTSGPSCSFTVTVNKLTLGASLADPLACAESGDKVNGSFSATNTSGSSATVSVSATLTNAVPLPNTAAATQPGAVVVLANVISWTGTLGAGQTVTVNWMGQIADNLLPGMQACSVTTATVNSLPVAGSVTACVTLNCQTPGPAILFPPASEASDQKAGSVLIYNIYTSGATSGNTQNTRINITNSHPTRASFVHLFFVAEGCSIADSYICLTGNQTASFLASDLDPGTTGYLVAVAVDGILGCPTSHNYLIGDEYVKFTSGHAANLGAIAFTQIAGGLPLCDGNSVTAALNFDGVSYNRTPAALALDNVGSRADGNDTLLILNRIGGNLGIGASTLGTLFGVMYDDAENALSFNVSGSCQLRNSISNNFPRTTPRFETFVPAGRTGWLKVFNQTGAIGITGAAINFNPNASSSAGAFNQGHNLHKLTLTNTASYIIPVFPPSC